MKPEYYSSEPYQRLIKAVIGRDYPGIHRIIEEQLAGTTGAEKAFWLFTRSGKWGIVTNELNRQRAWDDLEEALRTAPDDLDVGRFALNSALGKSLQTEKLDRLQGVIRRLQPNLRRLKTGWAYWLHIGDLHGLKGHWRQAYSAFDRSIQQFHEQGPEAHDSFKGYLPRLHCQRAVGAVACGHPGQAATDVETARHLFTTVSATAQNPLTMAVALAELALCRGERAEARSALQAGVTGAGLNPGHMPGDRRMIQVDLLAARIARADGNAAGFRHFAEKALSRAEQLDLQLSAAQIRRVMAGSER